jgi:hypothetical protein
VNSTNYPPKQAECCERNRVGELLEACDQKGKDTKSKRWGKIGANEKAGRWGVKK